MASIIDGASRDREPVATSRYFGFDAASLARAKGGASIVVCIPARDEEATIGPIVSTIRQALMGRVCLVDELLVVDDGSRDATASEAERCGALVLPGPGIGKGEAMRVARGRGDYVVYLDGDVENFGAHYVVGLVGALLCDPRVMMVKGCYARPLSERGEGGGRVTELVAKPLISLLWPELGFVTQPLAGETALRSEVLDKVELTGGYGVEMGLLLDVFSLWGADAIAQVDLGERRHRNRPLAELGPQAREVIAAALARAGGYGVG